MKYAMLFILNVLSMASFPLWAEETAPRIETVFVLDTTGSMGGLLEGAKQKIWSIANQIIAAKPKPKLKIALIAYRDRGDAYVTRVFDLSEDIDAVYANLRGFEAQGGGDGPESVNQALAEAVNKISWSGDKSVLKLVFLVGDFPPHMDYGDDVKYQRTCEDAVRRDLIINTVQCGSNAETAKYWQEIAKLAEGKYAAIGQTGDMQVVHTPMDAELAALNAEVGKTMVAYGGAEARARTVKKQVMAEAMAAPAAAERLAFNLGTGKVVQGRGDLLDDMKSGAVQLDGLSKDELPAELQGKSRAEQEQYLKAQSEKREEIEGRIAKLLKERQAYIDAERKKPAAGGKGGFDAEVLEMIRGEAARKGIAY